MFEIEPCFSIDYCSLTSKKVRREERKIFEAFYRAHDSLSSGIQGSGLGLTLAQRLAHEHDGEITYR